MDHTNATKNNVSAQMGTSERTVWLLVQFHLWVGKISKCNSSVNQLLSCTLHKCYKEQKGWDCNKMTAMSIWSLWMKLTCCLCKLLTVKSGSCGMLLGCHCCQYTYILYRKQQPNERMNFPVPVGESTCLVKGTIGFNEGQRLRVW